MWLDFGKHAWCYIWYHLYLYLLKTLQIVLLWLKQSHIFSITGKTLETLWKHEPVKITNAQTWKFYLFHVWYLGLFHFHFTSIALRKVFVKDTLSCDLPTPGPSLERRYYLYDKIRVFIPHDLLDLVWPKTMQPWPWPLPVYNSFVMTATIICYVICNVINYKYIEYINYRMHMYML